MPGAVLQQLPLVAVADQDCVRVCSPNVGERCEQQLVIPYRIETRYASNDRPRNLLTNHLIARHIR